MEEKAVEVKAEEKEGPDVINELQEQNTGKLIPSNKTTIAVENEMVIKERPHFEETDELPQSVKAKEAVIVVSANNLEDEPLRTAGGMSPTTEFSKNSKLVKVPSKSPLIEPTYGVTDPVPYSNL